MKGNLLVIGAGGHAKVVIDLALRSGEWSVVGILDDLKEMRGRDILGCAVLGGTEMLVDFLDARPQVVIAIGSNSVRERLQRAACSMGFVAATLVHPAATIASSAVLGAGTVVMPGAVVNAASVIGEGVVVNTGALIDHDCAIGDYCHVAPGVSLCGSVSVGTRSLIGVGASVVPGTAIGNDCVVGAGAVVVNAVPDGTLVVGVPARRVRSMS